jgi:hypothetical protein
MFDLEFADSVASALKHAVVSVRGSEDGLSERAPDDLQRICRRAAWQLLFDLDGKSLLELAMAKLAAEHSLAPKRAA